MYKNRKLLSFWSRSLQAARWEAKLDGLEKPESM
jgi:hypothetical protein